MRINNNLMAMNTHRQLGINNNMTSKSLEKLSSGFRINRAGDDAAGLAISEKMRAQVRGLNMASKNAQDGISLIQTAEGALNETHAILQRMRELAVQSATDTNTGDDRAKIQAEVDQLAKEITRISNTTEFNTQNLMAGGFSSIFHVGANKDQNVALSINSMDATSLGIAGNVVSQGATTAVGGVDTVSRIGTGLTAQTYKIETNKTDATSAADATSGAGTTGGANTIGTIGGTYTGADDAQLRIRVDSVDVSNAPSAISVSFDGGNTWGASTAYSGGMDIGNSLKWTAGTGAYAANNTISAVFEADKYTIQLQTAGGDSVGEAVTVKNGETSAIIGDKTTDATMTVGFTAGGITTAVAADFQVITTQESSKATVVNGVVTQQADTKAGISVSSQGSANRAIEIINDAITTVSEERSKLGAMQNRLEHTIKNLDTSAENLQASESRIRDVDMAKEMMEYTKQNILQQAATAMLAQSNQLPTTVLQLLR